MQTDRDRILAKIRALLERTEGKGCTEAEAATALGMARKLMDDYQVGHADLQDDAEGWTEETASHQEGFAPTNGQFISPILATFFRVRCFERTALDGRRVLLFGSKLDVEVAAWVYRFLESVYADLWLNHRLATKARKDRRRAFYEGLCWGLYGKLRDERKVDQDSAPASGRELARTLNAELDEAFAAAYPKIGQARHSRFQDTGTLKAGLAKGREINIARPVASSGPKALAHKKPEA